VDQARGVLAGEGEEKFGLVREHFVQPGASGEGFVAQPFAYEAEVVGVAVGIGFGHQRVDGEQHGLRDEEEPPPLGRQFGAGEAGAPQGQSAEGRSKGPENGVGEMSHPTRGEDEVRERGRAKSVLNFEFVAAGEEASGAIAGENG